MAVEITKEFVWQSIPPRARDSHKGSFGSVLAVALGLLARIGLGC